MDATKRHSSQGEVLLRAVSKRFSLSPEYHDMPLPTPLAKSKMDIFSSAPTAAAMLARCRNSGSNEPVAAMAAAAAIADTQSNPRISRSNSNAPLLNPSGLFSALTSRRNSRATASDLSQGFLPSYQQKGISTTGTIENLIVPFAASSMSLGGPRCECERVRINVSGQMFETRLGVLDRHPTTLLGNALKRGRYYDRSRDEYFFDRHRPSFEAIFHYYQYGGKLKRPLTVPDDVFVSEIEFFNLEENVIYEYRKAEGYVKDTQTLPKNAHLRRVWMLFEYPETSCVAYAIALISVVATLVSIVLFCVETLPIFATSHCVGDKKPNFLDPFFVIETTCTLWFTMEIIVRFIASPSKTKFFKDFKNIVDVLAVVPYYVTFFNVVSSMSCDGAKSSASLAFLRVIRLVRVFKLTKHSVGLQVLILTFKASLEGLSLFLVALVVCLLLFSSALYYAEFGIKGSHIQSIPDAFWYVIITMTTVGYGDKVPVGTLGKVLGSLCALTGVLTLAIPVPIITGNFNRFYAHRTGRGKHMREHAAGANIAI